MENCKKSIYKIELSTLKNKTIAIDISIYIHRFKSEGNLIEGIFSFNILLEKYGIIPIFVFDGKTPNIKLDTINERKQNRIIAKKKYDELLENKNPSDHHTLTKLKRDFIKITTQDMRDVKNLLITQNKYYINAEGEADYLCAKLVNDGVAYACMSEDTDMFVYGCRYVLRYLSLINKTVILYDFEYILDELNVTNEEFKTVCILTNNDYNNKQQNSLWKLMDYIKMYKNNIDRGSLLDYIINISDININSKQFNNIYKLYTLDNVIIKKKDVYIERECESSVIELLSSHNFVYIG